MAESSNSQNNDETELTMCDVLEEEQELEEDANAVLGASDDTNCSYDRGYVSRQALYSCVTCSTGQEPSGICLACSYKCHDGHEIVELYTKRKFRCDCGNSKFPDKTCSLKPDKEPLNCLNKYNQNFKGLYCSCSRPYPDLEDNTPDEMIQCVICEDWYHGRHIGGIVPDDYFEMICSKCMESHRFLYSYLNKFSYVNVTDDKTVLENKGECNGNSITATCLEDKKVTPVEVTDNKIVLKIEGECNGTSETPACLDDKEIIAVEVNEKKIHIKEEAATKQGTSESNVTEKPIEDTKFSLVNKAEVKSEEETTTKNGNSVCLLEKISVKHDGIMTGPAFWPENWRKELCQCSSCMDMYHKYHCDFLLNLDDTILAYEERGKSTNESQYDKGLNALSKLDRVKQMEAIRAYTSMKGQLKEYLKEFASNKRTVCESDIKEFFERISKRQKLSNGVPHFCR